MVLLLVETFGNPFLSVFEQHLINFEQCFTVDCIIVFCKVGFFSFEVVKLG